MSYSAIFEHPSHVESIKIAGDYMEKGGRINIGLVSDSAGRKHTLFFNDAGHLLVPHPGVIVAVNDDPDIPF